MLGALELETDELGCAEAVVVAGEVVVMLVEGVIVTLLVEVDVVELIVWNSDALTIWTEVGCWYVPYEVTGIV